MGFPHFFRYVTVSVLICVATQLWGQIEYGGTPAGPGSAPVPTVHLPAPDLRSLRAEDEINDGDKSVPYRFGANIPVDIGIEDFGAAEIGSDGSRTVWMSVKSPGAVSLNFQFDVFDIPEGARVFIYSPDMRRVKGSYTRENASEINSLGVGLIYGDEAIIEYTEPAEFGGTGRLHLDNVTHGYRSIAPAADRVKTGPFGNAGLCNINVNCPEGLPYDFEKRSVAIIVVNNNGLCTGALVNNTAQDFEPYFLTANHCLPGFTGQVANWVFYFNHEAPNCIGNDGPVDQSVSGANLLARSAHSDFALLRLSAAPPDEFGVCYAGWNVSDDEEAVTSAVGIHHPRGDVKKICFADGAPSHRSNTADFVNETWFVDRWDSGVTEPGSSGSPLFDQNGNIIGVLSGGAAACNGGVNNGLHDFYGRLDVAHSFGDNAAERLSDWLDPINSGLTRIPNTCEAPPVPDDLTLARFDNVETSECNAALFSPEMSVINTGTSTAVSLTYTFSLNDAPADTLSMDINIEPGQVQTLTLPEVQPADGENSLRVEVITVNGVPDEREAGNVIRTVFYRFFEDAEVRVRIRLDDYPQETTWRITSENGTALYTGGPYGANDPGSTVTESFCIGREMCFYFEIFDLAGDGLCCAFGQGFYAVEDGDGRVRATGASFGSEARHTICYRLPGAPIPEEDVRFGIYPNPTDFSATFLLKGHRGDEAEIRVFDTRGRAVWQNLTYSAESEIAEFPFPANQLNAGVYVVVIEAGGERYSSRMVVVR